MTPSTLAERLANLGVAAAAAPDSDALRARLLCNLVAAVGHQSTLTWIEAMETAGSGARAFALAARMHGRTQDDFYPPGRTHIGAVVVPPVLMLQAGNVLPAIAAGYEVLTVVSEVYAADAQVRGFRPSGIFGPIGAAAAATVARGGSTEELAASIAAAAAAAGGTNQAWLDGGDEWLFQVGAAARAGLEISGWVREGLGASPRAFEGSAGWANAFFGDAGAVRLIAQLDQCRTRTADVAVKLYPVSGIAQVPSRLAASLWVADSLPQSISVHMAPAELDYPGSRNRGPFRGRSDSLMSVTRCVALASMYGRIPSMLLADPPQEDEVAVIDSTTLVGDDSLGETEAEVCVKRDGDRFTVRGSGQHFLYPAWSDVVADLDGLARRSEADPRTVERLAVAVERAEGAPILEVLRR